MRIIDITHPPQSLWIGREGENTFRPVSFECANWFSAYPNATIAAYYQPYGSSDPYPLVLVEDGTKRIWHPLLNELVKGDGELQIVLMQGETVGTSAIIPTKVERSLISNADHPASEAPSWAVEVVQDVEEAASHYPKIVNDYWWVWDVQTDTWVNTGVKARGEGGGGNPNAVLYTPQTITPAQQEQARSNLGITYMTAADIDEMWGSIDGIPNGDGVNY